MGTFLAGGIFILGPSSRCPTSSHQPTWMNGCLWESLKSLSKFDKNLLRRGGRLHWMNITINLQGKCQHFHNPSTGRSPPPNHQSELWEVWGGNLMQMFRPEKLEGRIWLVSDEVNDCYCIWENGSFTNEWEHLLCRRMHSTSRHYGVMQSSQVWKAT